MKWGGDSEENSCEGFMELYLSWPERDKIYQERIPEYLCYVIVKFKLFSHLTSRIFFYLYILALSFLTLGFSCVRLVCFFFPFFPVSLPSFIYIYSVSFLPLRIFLFSFFYFKAFRVNIAQNTPLLGNNKEKTRTIRTALLLHFLPQLCRPSESKKLSDFDMHGSLHRRKHTHTHTPTHTHTEGILQL